MHKQDLDNIIAQIARENHTTPKNVRRQMEYAMKEAQTSNNPAIRAKWEAIPRNGKELTLEEFIEYCAKHLRS